MLRVTSGMLSASKMPASAGQQMEFTSAYQLLRLLLRSIERKVPSRHGRKYLKQRALTQWRLFRNVKDPFQQRFVMERAGAVVTALHMTEENKKQGTAPQYNWEKVTASNKPSRASRKEQFDKEFK